MLFQLDDLNLTPDAFRTLFTFIRSGYHSKIIRTKQEDVVDKLQISKYRVRQAIAELKERRLIQVKRLNDGIEITLMPDIIRMIDLDLKRRGHHKKGDLREIAPKVEPEKKKRSTVTKAKSKALPLLKQKGHSPSTPQKNTSPCSGNGSKSSKPSKPVPSGSLPPLPISMRSLPCCSSTGTLFAYFQSWLKSYEQLKLEDIKEIQVNEKQILKYWARFEEYTVTFGKLQKVTSNPCRDLNKIKFYRRIATQYLERTQKNG